MALHAFRRDDAQSRVKAGRAAEDFLKRLHAAYGENAMLQFDLAPASDRITPRIQPGDMPIEDAEIRVETHDDLAYLDLVDLSTGVAIRNFYVVDTREEPTTFVLPLRLIWFTRPIAPPDGREVRELPEGQTEIRAYDDDGKVTTVRLSKDLSARTLPRNAEADWI